MRGWTYAITTSNGLLLVGDIGIVESSSISSHTVSMFGGGLVVDCVIPWLRRWCIGATEAMPEPIGIAHEVFKSHQKWILIEYK